MKKQDEWKKTFWKIWIGQAVSIVTSAIVQFAIIWYITDKTGSAFWLSMASLCGFLPQGILGLFIGSYIDKRNRKKIMIISDSFIALVSLILVMVAIFIDLPIWLILVVLAIRSVGSAFHGPSLQASIPLIVPKEKLLNYSGYSQSLQSISLILSPVIAAFMYESIKLSSIILLDVIGVLIAVFALIISKIPNPEIGINNKVDFVNDTKEGIKLILKTEVIKFIFIISAIFMIIFMPINALYPLMTKVYFGGNSYHAGIVEMLFAIGMLVGSIIIATDSKIFKNRKINIFLSLMIIGITLLISGLIPNNLFIIFAVMCLIMGFAGPLFNTTTTTIFGEQIAPEFLGRVFSNFVSLSVLAMPIGLFLSGMFADKIGINIWFAVSGILIIILSIFQLNSKIIYECEKQNNNLNE